MFKGNKKVENQLKGKKTKRLTGYDKLVDASNAGTKNAHLCTLILTEGDSGIFNFFISIFFFSPFNLAS